MDIKQKGSESNREYVTRIEQMTKLLNLVTWMERIKNVKDNKGSKEKKGNSTHYRDRSRHGDLKTQGERYRGGDKWERRVQNVAEDAKRGTQDWSDIEETKDEEIEDLVQTAADVKNGESRKNYTVQRGRGVHAVYIQQQKSVASLHGVRYKEREFHQHWKKNRVKNNVSIPSRQNGITNTADNGWNKNGTGRMCQF